MVRSSARRSPHPHDGWDALADINVFIAAAEAELQAMDRERAGPRRRGRKPDPDLRRRMLGLIWILSFGGMQWRMQVSADHFGAGGLGGEHPLDPSPGRVAAGASPEPGGGSG